MSEEHLSLIVNNVNEDRNDQNYEDYLPHDQNIAPNVTATRTVIFWTDVLLPGHEY